MAASQEIGAVFVAQREAREARRVNFDRAARIAALDRLRAAILDHEAEIVAACAADFRKPEAEVRLTEIFPVLQEIRHAKRHLRRWMRARRVAPTLGSFGTRARIRPEPRGVCLIIAPWNYPVNLALGPLVSALAAGNSAIVKPSELTPESAKVVAAIVARAFAPDLVAVAEGGVEVSQALLALPFDHVFFTGSPAVGKIVMAAAAEHLASVTLELGGKSPAIVGPEADLKKAARHICWGKFANNGQTCIAPDHVFVHRDVAEAFEAALKAEIGRVYGGGVEAQKASPDYCRIVNDRHFGRLRGLMADAAAKGARVVQGGEAEAAERFIAPTLVTRVTGEMEIAREEIFGPILPLIDYGEIDEVIARINAGEKPLALYIFDRRRGFADHVIARTSSGGVGVNLTVLQYSHPNLPFGGVNHSGLGAAHWAWGFRAFSHEKPVMENRFSIAPMLFPPYTARVRRLIGAAMRFLG